jgi:hypothetical protein
VEPILEAALVASLLDEFAHDIVSFGITWFKSFRIVQNEKFILA